MTTTVKQDGPAATDTGAPQDVDTRIGKLSFTHDFANGYPTKETVEKLYDERDFQRACQAYLWALPMVSMGELENIYSTCPGVTPGDWMLLETLPEISRLTTPNTLTPYVLNWLDLANSGPLVLEVPAAAVAGMVDDLWQRPVTDLGQLGPDKGKGGKYLLVGPGQDTPDGADGYFVVQSPSNNGFIGLRLLAADPMERQQALAAARVYPYAKRANPPANKVVKPDNRTNQNSAPRGMAFWEKLSHWVNKNPVEERDRMLMAMLRSIGIEKGKPFKPDARQTKILTEAVLVGEAMAKANDFDKRDMPLAHYADGSRWHFALCFDVSQEADYFTQMDERAAFTYEAQSTAHGMVTKTPGVGSTYLGSYMDKAGDWLDGANTYRLHVLPNAPVAQFWAMTVYDVDSRTFIVNGSDTVERNSRQADLVKNADGSVDLYVGPEAPAGFEKNWIRSVPGKAWFSYFRLYAPTEGYFDRTWILPDFEKVN
jgi:hypothetical protein